MRVVAIDFGGARIGCAAGDQEAGIASPRSNLPASGTLAKDAEAIVKFAQKEEADLIVVGLPLSHGEETKGSLICRRLGDEIVKRGPKVAYQDEALSSQEAEGAMEGFKASEKRKQSDGAAACVILERYFASQP